MPWQGNQFVRTDGTRTGSTVWQQAQAAGVDIISTDHDTHDEDQAQGITDCINRNGANTVAADINWGNFKITSLATGTASGDAVNKGQMDAADGTLQGNIDSLSATVDTKLANVVEDTSPQLGGSLDVNGNAIVSVTNGAINITPDGTGRVVMPRLTLADYQMPDSAGTDGQTFVFSGGNVVVGAASPFTEYGESSPQNWTTGSMGTISLASLGLTGEPKEAGAKIECVVADQGYSVGDKISYSDATAAAASINLAISFDTTNVYFSVGSSGLMVPSKNGGGSGITTNDTNFRIIVTAKR